MAGELEPLQPDEVAVVPIDLETGLVLALGHDLHEEGEPVARGLLDAALDKAGFLGGAYAATSLLDGSLVRLAPETVEHLKDGAVFLKDAQGFALGSLRTPSVAGVRAAVRLLPEASDPIAAGLMLQTMAIQRQLGQIQDALEEIDAKLDEIIKGQHHGILGSLLSLAEPLEEIARKLRDGHPLTEADEVSLRGYEDEARRRQHEASLWLANLHQLLTADDPSLRQQHDLLEKVIKREHVAFWIRIYIVSQITLARARCLRLSRAAAVEAPEWAQQLQHDVTRQLDSMADEVVALARNLDRYLRDHDIASGIEELALQRKRRVRRLRRQLREVHEGLRAGVEASEASLRLMLQDAESFEIPSRLSRRDVEPWLVRDPLYDASKVGWAKAKELSAEAGDVASQSFAEARRRMEQELEKRRGTAQGDADETAD